MPANPSTANDWRSHFPALHQRVGDRPLAYLDTAATSQRPVQVINAIADFYRKDNANPSGALHALARRANDRYEGARKTVGEFIGARDPLEVVFTRGTTEAINLVASSWCGANLKPGDEILVGVAEHSSNMLPWQMAAKRNGAVIRYFDIDDDGHLRLDDFDAKLSRRTRLVAFSHVSNVLGMINPARELTIRAHAAGATVLIDGAQSAPHFALDVHDIGCDFLAFSGHKMCGPMGCGVLWGKRELLEAMPPYQAGSNMAHDVDIDSMHASSGALKFGAGTPNVADAVGLAAAATFLRGIGLDALWKHEQSITRHMLDQLQDIPKLHLLGTTTPEAKIAVFAFTIEGRSALDVAQALDREGIAVRAGDLASLPLLRRLGTTAAVRASCYLYTTTDEVDALAHALQRIAR